MKSISFLKIIINSLFNLNSFTNLKCSLTKYKNLGIQEEAQENGFSIMLGNTQYDIGVEQKLLRRFQERQVAGLILTGFSVGQERFIKEGPYQGVEGEEPESTY